MRRVVTFAAAAVLWAPRVAGQTRFSWPDTSAFNMSTYPIEACRAMTRRAWRALTTRRLLDNRVWWDTMPVNPLDSDSEPVTRQGQLENGAEITARPVPGLEAEVRRCLGTRISGKSAPLMSDSTLMTRRSVPTLTRFFKPYDLFPTYFALFRDAGLDADMTAYVDRYLQGASSKDVEARLANVLEGFEEGIHGSTAKRWLPLAEELVVKYAPRVTDHVRRALFYWYVVPNYSQRERFHLDTTVSLRAATRLQKFIADSLTAAERQALWTAVANNSDTIGVRRLPVGTDTRYGKTLDEYLRVLFEDIRIGRESHRLTRGLDSLRKSTEAYLAFWRSPTEGGWSEWKHTTDGKDSVLVWHTAVEAGWGGPIGRTMPPITGVTWIGPPVAGPRPTPGRVSLLYFTGGCTGLVATADDERGECAPALIALRRIIDSFPSLEVTVVTVTHRYFKYVVDSLTPVREAELFRQLLASYGIKNVTVGIWERPFVKLPEPDGRIMERNEYPFGVYTSGDPRLVGAPDSQGVASQAPLEVDRNYVGFPGFTMLLDENGVAVYQVNLGERTWHYGELAEFVRVLLKRSKAMP